MSTKNIAYSAQRIGYSNIKRKAKSAKPQQISSLLDTAFSGQRIAFSEKQKIENHREYFNNNNNRDGEWRVINWWLIS